MHRLPIVICLTLIACTGGSDEGWDSNSADLTAAPKPTLTSAETATDPVIDGVGDEAAWASAPVSSFSTFWSGKTSPTTTHVRTLWNEHALYMLLDLEGAGLNVDTSRPVGVERVNLYEEDCVEIFFTPDPAIRQRYFEIELGPKGHFFDLLIDHRTNLSDQSWSSNLEIETTTDAVSHRATIEVAFRNPEMLATLKSGAKLPINMFRMEGKTPREYLAWSPTLTPRPNFHVVDAFGTLALP